MTRQLIAIDGSTDEITMTSREIAELTGKRHDNVVRDIRNMLEELGLDDEGGLLRFEETPGTALKSEGSDSPQIWREYRDPTGRMLPEAHLDRDLTLTLVSGYSAKLRYTVVKRMRALETQLMRVERAALARQWAAREMVLVSDLTRRKPHQPGSEARYNVLAYYHEESRINLSGNKELGYGSVGEEPLKVLYADGHTYLHLQLLAPLLGLSEPQLYRLVGKDKCRTHEGFCYVPSDHLPEPVIPA